MALTTGTGLLLSRTTSLPSATSFTITAWARITSFATDTGIFGLGDNGTGTAWKNACIGKPSWDNYFYVTSDGGAASITGLTPATNTWYFFALSVAASGASNLKGYIGSASSGNLATVSGTADSFTPTGMVVGKDLYWNVVFPGQVAAIKIWNAALTAEELEKERFFYSPIRTANLHLWCPCVDSAIANNIVDLSGNAKNFTQTGTPSVADGPPISWQKKIWLWLPAAAAGGATITPAQGTLTLTGQVAGLKLDLKPSQGELTLSSQTPTISISTVTTISPSTGTLTLTNQSPSLNLDLKPTQGTLTFSGQTASILQNYRFIPTQGELTLTGQIPTIQAGATTTISPGVGELILTGYGSTLDLFLKPSQTDLTLTSQTPTVIAGATTTISPGLGELTLTSQTPSLNYQFQPSQGELTLSGQIAALQLDVKPSQGTLTWTGQAPTIYAAGFTLVEPAAATLTLSSQTPSIYNAASYSDDFNRDDESPLAGNWKQLYSRGLRLSSNAIIGPSSAGDAGHRWNAGSFYGNQFSQVEVKETTQAKGVAVRYQDSTVSGYVAYFSGGNVTLYREDNDVSTIIGSSVSAPLSIGDIIRIEARGSTISALVNGVVKRTVTDSTYSNGWAGIFGLSTTCNFDNWIGGNLLGYTTLTPDTGVLTLSGQIPVIPSEIEISPSVGTLTLTGNIAGLNFGVLPSQGALTLTGQVPGITVSVNAIIQPDVGTLTLVGNSPLLNPSPNLATLTLVGEIPNILSASVGLSPCFADLILTSRIPIIYNLAPVDMTGDLNYYRKYALDLAPSSPGREVSRNTASPISDDIEYLRRYACDI